MDFSKLKKNLEKYAVNRQKYINKIDEAKRELSEYEKDSENTYMSFIEENKKESFEWFCKSANHLYKNRREIVKSGFAHKCVIDFLKFDHAVKISLHDLLNAWEEGLTFIENDKECLIIGFDRNFYNQPVIVNYIQDGNEYIKFMPKKEFDKFICSIRTDITNTYLSERYSDLDNYTRFCEIPHSLLNIEEW